VWILVVTPNTRHVLATAIVDVDLDVAHFEIISSGFFPPKNVRGFDLGGALAILV